MFSKDKQVMIGGKHFDYLVYEYLLSRFKEAFSHSSLTIEKAFLELDELDTIIESGKSVEAYQYYQLLSSNEQKQIKDILKQIIVFKGSKFGVFTETLDGSQKQINKLYNQHFKYFDDYILYYIQFNSLGKLDKSLTFQKVGELFETLPRRNMAYHRAYNMQKDHLDAFDYAISLDEITIPDVIQINSIVNKSDPDKVEGFKKTNNDIFTASFKPTDKTEVPVEMQKLFADYKNNFGEELLDPSEAGLSQEERMDRVYKIFRREAIFHIRFERIHPFTDGNGRTGRIIMNHNLLKEHFAPVIITNYMSSEYKKYISDFNIDAFTQLLANSSSQQMANWVSINKTGVSLKKNEVNPDNSTLATLDGYKVDEEKKDSKKALLKKINHVFTF